jgi:predicted phosphoadenosine phosphosulfate sulfurtransferase
MVLLVLAQSKLLEHNSMGKKNFQEDNVYVASKKRIEYCFKNYDKVCVSFSGGKDSTAVLNVALEVAKETGKLPLDVMFFDEEVLHPPTVEYVERISKNPDLNFIWLCMEWKHRNACSNESPYWYCWDSDNKDLWVRDLPATAITEHKRFKKGLAFQDFSAYYYEKSVGSVVYLTGIRTEESLRRMSVICSKQNDNYIQSAATWNAVMAHPIYDWSSKDVWLAVHKFGWDYNKTYDIFNKTKLYQRYLTQRVCPPYGEEPLRGLWLYSQCFPELWHKMLHRVPGVATAWRYGNTEIYSSPKTKPEHLNYKEYLEVILKSYSKKYQNEIKKTLNGYIKRHTTKSSEPIPEELSHPLTGLSWQFLCRCVLRGDFKGRQINVVNNNAIKARDKLNMTMREAEIKHGRK